MIKEFGCEQCGHIMKVAPPDDAHIIFSINKITDSCQKTIYKCDDCNKELIRYWCTEGTPVVVSGSYEMKEHPDGYYS